MTAASGSFRPAEGLEDGEVRGLATRGAVEVDVTWKEGKATEAGFCGPYAIRYCAARPPARSSPNMAVWCRSVRRMVVFLCGLMLAQLSA